LLHICERMMSKDPDDRYQTAGEVAERLTEWLKDRGQAVGDSGNKSGTGSGVGSDVLKGFAATFAKQSGLSKSGSSAKTVVPKKLNAQGKGKAVKVDDEEIGLAPLEEDAPREEDSFALSDASGSSGGLAEALKDTVAEGPHKSLIEEALEKEEQAEKANRRFVSAPGEIDPLRPPGYVNPGQGIPVWLYLVIGVGVCVVLGGIVAMLSGN